MPNPIKKRLTDMLDDDLFIPRELSWLSFNERVLQEAADESVPIIQRVRYLGIYSSNLDEFFRVRVAEVRRVISLSTAANKQNSQHFLATIQKRVVDSHKRFDLVYSRVLKDLRAKKIYLINEEQLDEGQAAWVQDYFTKTVLPELEPILLRDSQPIPTLNDESLYLAVDIRAGEEYHYAVLKVPTDRLDRFVQIPKAKGRQGKVFIVLDNIIRACLAQTFRGVIPIDEAHAYCFKFSRDAELELGTGISQSLIDKMTRSLKQRLKADAVRLVYDETIPERLLERLSVSFGFGRYDSFISGGRFHNSKDFIGFPNVGPKYLEFKPLPPIRLPRLDEARSLFDAIAEKDVLLYYPYHTFDHVIDLLKTAALDPLVSEIKVCLYRVAKNSRVIDALLNAVHNGKIVTAAVELAARFDEEANISWAQRLTEGGINVIFGLPGLKVHSKLLLIERRENNSKQYYTHIGTGNFNEKTATLYTDYTLLTRNRSIGKDVRDVFEFLQFNYKVPRSRLLLVSPHSARPGLMQLIENEIDNAQAGYRGSMTLKCNNLVDKEVVLKLYEASQAGVEIKLIIRGMCSLLPGVKGISENIQALSIIDRYLEHPRVYVFHNRGAPRYLIGSADLMTRNLDYRVEVLCPILDEDAQKLIQDVLDQQWNDNVKARILDQNQTNKLVGAKPKSAKIRSQETIHRYLSTGKLPRYPKSRMNVRARRRLKLKAHE